MNNNRNIKFARLLIIMGAYLILFSLSVAGYYFYSLNKPPVISYHVAATTTTNPAIVESGWMLNISKLGIEAPIVINVDGNDEKKYMESLQNGVAHLKGTETPGQNGNIFIFGHSSYYFFDPGKYKEVFKNLENVEIDNEITIKSNIKEYKYKVIGKKIVAPDDVNVTSDIEEGKEYLSLMTCTPTGTSLYRLIVIAERV